MHKLNCVPMIALCLLLCGCGGTREEQVEDLRTPFREMSGCAMEAKVSCDQDGALWTATLRCDYAPEGDCTVEVLAPETIAGVKAVLDAQDCWRLEYQDACLDAGTLSAQELSPASCLPRLMNALRDGWLLEENEEDWAETPCTRLTVDQTGREGGKLVSTLWLRQEDGTPIRGEIAVDGETILTAEFTSFVFCDKMDATDQQVPAG